MNKKRYEMTVRFFTENKIAHTILTIIYKVLPNVMFVAYPALLLAMFFILGFRREWVMLVCVPLGVLLLVSVLRMVIDAERPYEKYGIPSVFDKKTERQSMPSRHTASAYIIAMTFLKVNPPLGFVALFIASLIEASRVMAGAHFIRDVVVGAVIGISAGIIFYFVI
ncbi:MAG: phosphatase PAP2 family protein [Ruminococcus sp.]|nr:phosphatase PAP2 family protein [Ruminococcus sp.]